MSHEVESLAYNQAEPVWHGLGIPVSDNLSPTEILKIANLNWTVRKEYATVEINGERVAINRSALLRESDNTILDIVTDPWEPTQNQEAFDFFSDFVKFGQMKMECAGSLRNGKIVFALAKMMDGVTLWGKDQIDAYLLFSNPHLFGMSRDISFTPVRVVCANTHKMAIQGNSVNRVKQTHRKKFNPEEVKELLGISLEKLQKYKEMAMFLGQKRYNPEDLENYVKQLLPVTDLTGTAKKQVSKSAKQVLDIVETQPGANFVPGTWWNAYNAITYYTDHLACKTKDVRMASAWFGVNKTLKDKAVNLAMKLAA